MNSAELLQHWWQGLRPSQQTEHQQELQRQLQELGAPTQLAALPHYLSATDWAWLQAGLAQQHRLLAMILADLYGEQDLLKRQLLPAKALFAQPGFLLPCHQLLKDTTAWLPLLSSDLVSDGHGRYQLRQHHSKVHGLGLVLQHRLAFNQLSIEPGQQMPRLQLAGFFRQLKQLLQTDAAQSQPMSALLGLPRQSSSYTEFSFLASYLDLPLLQAADLMFKDGAIYLKTVTGLQPIHHLLSLLPDAQCDALELSSAGAGPAGLLQSIRNQQLHCLNPPGAALIEGPWLLPFLPALCRHLLHEELLLPVVPSYWGGQSPLHTLVQGPGQLHQLSTNQHWRWSEQTAVQQQRLFAAITQSPEDFIWQPEPTPPAQDEAQAFVAACAQLRFFSLMQQDITLLPGALLQQAQTVNERQPASYQEVWIEGQSRNHQSLWSQGVAALPLSRQTGLLPSRVADHLFWLGRYNERLNLMCRVLRQLLQMALIEHNFSDQDAAALLSFCLQANGAKAPTQLTGDPQSLNQLLTDYLAELCDPTQPGSLPHALQGLLYNASSVRDYFSEDTWYVLEQLQRNQQQWPGPSLSLKPAALVRWLDQLILLQTAIYGLNNETMTRTPGLNFLQIGQQLERALQMSSLLHCCFCQPQSVSASLLEALLRLTDTQVTYRRRYKSVLHPLAVLDLLLLDDSTPRSVCYPLQTLQSLMQRLPAQAQQRLSVEQKLALDLYAQIQLIDPQQLLHADLHASPLLAQQLTELQQRLRQLSDRLSLSYFSHAEPGYSWQRF